MSEEIRNLLDTYQRALNEADLDLVRSVYARDAIVIGQPFPTATGIEAILALYADFLSKLDFNVQFDLLEMELRDDLGFIRTHSHGTSCPKGGARGQSLLSIVVEKILLVFPWDSRRSDQISSLIPLTVRSFVFTSLPYGSDNYFSSDKKAGGLD